jgi:tetratricopeptide (TPR) repeat protein
MILSVASCAKNPTVRDDIKRSFNERVAMGNEEFKKGSLVSAKMFFDEALRNAYSIDDVYAQILVLINLGEVALAIDDVNGASNNIFLAREIADKSGLEEHNFILNISFGKLHIRFNRIDLAKDYYYKALNTAKKDTERAVAYNNLGIVYSRDDAVQYEKALEYLEKAMVINLRGPAYDQLADNYYNAGNVLFNMGRLQTAKENYEKALESDKITENSRGIIKDLRRLASTSLALGNRDDALFYYERALRVARSIRATGLVAEFIASVEMIKSEGD